MKCKSSCNCCGGVQNQKLINVIGGVSSNQKFSFHIWAVSWNQKLFPQRFHFKSDIQFHHKTVSWNQKFIFLIEDVIWNQPLNSSVSSWRFQLKPEIHLSVVNTVEVRNLVLIGGIYLKPQIHFLNTYISLNQKFIFLKRSVS